VNIGSIAGIEHYGGVVVQVKTRVESASFQCWKPE
jgi:hypothetical protein